MSDVAAQKQAVARQELADQTNLGGQLAGVDALEKNHAPLEAARRAGVDAYVASHGLPARTCSAASRPGVAGVHPDTGPAAGPVAAADTVAVPRADLEAFSQIELQNSEWQSFGQSLIDQGLAVKASEAR